MCNLCSSLVLQSHPIVPQYFFILFKCPAPLGLLLMYHCLTPFQCTNPGFCMSCESIPMAYVVSRCGMMVDHRIDQIASEYGIPFIQATWLSVNGDCWFVNWVFISMDVNTLLALMSPIFQPLILCRLADLLILSQIFGLTWFKILGTSW